MSTTEFGIQSKVDTTPNTHVKVCIIDRTYNREISYRYYNIVGPGYSFEGFNQFIYHILEGKNSIVHISSTREDDIDFIEFQDHRISFITKNNKYSSRIDVIFTDRNKEKIITELMELNNNLKKISNSGVPQIESSFMNTH